MVLNVLFLIGCAGIITIGPSLTAMYTVLLKLVRNESGYIAREYWRAFRDNFRQAAVFPRESVIGASAVTDETQTNWNGVIGDFSVYETGDLILKDLRILPTETGLEISMEADGQFPEEDGKEDLCISLESGALEEEIILPLKELMDGNKIQIRDIPLSPLCRMWDEGEG